MAPTAMPSHTRTMGVAKEGKHMPWVLLGLVLGLIAVAVGLGTVFVVRRRDPALREAMSGDQMFTLGVIFTGTGIALSVSIGPHMLGIMALGIIYMGIGAAMKRREREDEHEGMT